MQTIPDNFYSDGVEEARCRQASDSKDMERTCARDIHVLPSHPVVVKRCGRWLARDAVGIAAFGFALPLEADITWRVRAGARRRPTLFASRRCAKVELLPVAEAGCVVIHTGNGLHVSKPLRPMSVVLSAPVRPFDRRTADVVGGVLEALALRSAGSFRCFLQGRHGLTSPLQCVQRTLLLARALVVEA